MSRANVGKEVVAPFIGAGFLLYGAKSVSNKVQPIRESLGYHEKREVIAQRWVEAYKAKFPNDTDVTEEDISNFKNIVGDDFSQYPRLAEAYADYHAIDPSLQEQLAMWFDAGVGTIAVLGLFVALMSTFNYLDKKSEGY